MLTTCDRLDYDARRDLIGMPLYLYMWSKLKLVRELEAILAEDTAEYMRRHSRLHPSTRTD